MTFKEFECLLATSTRINGIFLKGLKEGNIFERNEFYTFPDSEVLTWLLLADSHYLKSKT